MRYCFVIARTNRDAVSEPTGPSESTVAFDRAVDLVWANTAEADLNAFQVDANRRPWKKLFSSNARFYCRSFVILDLLQHYTQLVQLSRMRS
ncbi:MAG: hypothetical protein U0930_22015 [Pirellulales bacterium]